MGVDEDKDHRSAIGVKIAENVPPSHISHDVFNGSESSLNMRCIVHSQEDTGY